MTRYVRLFWPSTHHAAYRTPFGQGIHAGLISPDGEALLEPLSSKVLRGGPLVPTLSTWMPPKTQIRSDLERHEQAHNRLTFWRRDIKELSFDRRGVVGELWGSLEVLLDYGEPVATRGLRSDSKLPYRLEFSLDGERFTTSAAYYYREPVVAEEHAPPPRRTLGSVLSGLRAALLYHYLPFDKSAFGRLQSPPSLLLQLLAVGPMWLRGPFFTLFLLLTLMDTPDEYTLMRFILGLKSSQVLTGILLAISGLVQFFECAVVADPPDCGADAPGVRDNWLVDAAFCVWLQLLTLAAFAMLPSAVDIAQHGPVVSRRASVAPTIEEVAPAPSPPPSPPNDASTPGACATGVLASEFNSLGGTPLLALPSVGSRALGEGWPSCDAALAATDAAADATPLRRSGFDGRTAARPQRKFNLRFVALVKWDLACFLCSLLLLLAAVVHAAPSWESLLHSADPWTDWRAACAFFICIRVIFALTAFPFALFEVPGLSQLLAWTSPSGYAPDGRLVAEDVGGFSAYVAWLEGVVSSRAARRHLGARELQLLQRAAAAARRHLKRTPHLTKSLGRRRIEELEGLLTSLVPPKSPLFGTVFPDKMLCNQYKQRLAQEQADTAPGAPFETGASASTHAAKYGVQWESDATSTQCRLCGGKWGLLRRRHHCRACGQLVCGDCSRSRIHVPGSDNPKRSCDLCTAARRDEQDFQPTDSAGYGGESSRHGEPRPDSAAGSDVDPNQARLRELL